MPEAVGAEVVEHAATAAGQRLLPGVLGEAVLQVGEDRLLPVGRRLPALERAAGSHGHGNHHSCPEGRAMPDWCMAEVPSLSRSVPRELPPPRGSHLWCQYHHATADGVGLPDVSAGHRPDGVAIRGPAPACSPRRAPGRARPPSRRCGRCPHARFARSVGREESIPVQSRRRMRVHRGITDAWV
jgi:hypothetical protein